MAQPFTKLPPSGRLNHTATLVEAAQSMLKQPDIVIINDHHEPIGVVTYSNILAGLDCNSGVDRTVAEIMSKNFMDQESNVTFGQALQNLRNTQEAKLCLLKNNEITGWIYLYTDSSMSQLRQPTCQLPVSATLHEVAQKLLQRFSIVVVDSAKTVGVIHIYELLKWLGTAKENPNLKVADFMSTDFVDLNNNDSINDIIKKMHEVNRHGTQIIEGNELIGWLHLY